MTALSAIETRLRPHSLAVMGGFHAKDDPALPEGCKTLLLIGPAEPGFWPHFTRQPEWRDGQPDPMDRWSQRVLTALATGLGATAVFPFGGPPWHPFYQWALRSGAAWESPLRLLVHAQMGLFASYRGALALPQRIALPAPPAKPCDSCPDKPCLTACPVQALGADGYNLPACHGFLDQDAGQDCMNMGCAARRACPLSLAYARLPEQSAYHMRQFHK
ncbi:ferredoxin [Pseudorhodobacter sp. E13]|uniref:ferredoxin n=1 Tax=Pseudorhodobacter sp. E13 TaxID=2487931 RepID=UPI000F8EF6E7|nr:ferredoxin [Pseudorhodobacter sp. E13]RUS58611.1 ferredoxin [Pseudorhodobacter sp. E13]